MTRGIAPGVLCRINERAFYPENVGALVWVERPYGREEILPGHRYPFKFLGNQWVVRADSRPLVDSDCLDGRELSVSRACALTPITPPDDAQDSTIDTPADAVAA